VIGELSLKIPWQSLGKSPVQVRVANVFIILEPRRLEVPRHDPTNPMQTNVISHSPNTSTSHSIMLPQCLDMVDILCRMGVLLV